MAIPLSTPEIGILTAVHAVLITTVALNFLRDRDGAWKEWKASRRWPTAPGKITQSTVKTIAIEDEFTRFRLAVQYTYTAPNGQTYRATRTRLGSEPDFTSHAQATLALPAIATAVQVFYNPANPSQATLSLSAPSLRRKRLIGWIIITGLSASLLLMLAVIARQSL